MKKANSKNFFMIAILFIFFYILRIIFTQNKIDISLFQLEYEIVIVLGSYLIFMGISIIYLSRTVFNIYIKHKKGNLRKPRLMLLISSLFVGYLLINFDLEYYYYFGAILVSYFLYFILLYIYDVYYVKKSRKTKVKVNEETVNLLIDILGGKENIIQVSYESSRLKVELKNIKLVDLTKIKDLGAQGAFVAGNKLQAMVGQNASDLENAIKDYMTNIN